LKFQKLKKSGDEKYNEYNEKCNRTHQYQNRSGRRICEVKDRLFENIHSEKKKKKMKRNK
jgi:hypothetical protein